MRSKSAKFRIFTSKRKETKQKDIPVSYEEPTPTLQNAAHKITVSNVNELYELMDIRYYEHLQHSYDIVWNDISDKEGKTL